MLASLSLLLLSTPPQLAQDWIPLSGPDRPSSQAAFDSARGRLVLLGTEGETWEIEGASLLHRANLGADGEPTRRSGGAMAANEDGTTVLFGGLEMGNGTAVHYFDDTWLWDGRSWTEDERSPAPPARYLANLVFDSVRSCFVLYGGNDASGNLYDTWEYRGASGWSLVPTASSPTSARGKLAFDAARGVVVHVAGPSVLGQPMILFEYDGSDWTSVPSNAWWPTHRSNMSLAYDAVRHVTVMLGGTYDGEEIWEWNGSYWLLAGNELEASRIDAPAYFDPSLGAVVLYGGRVGSGPPIERSDAWCWNGSSFTQLFGERIPAWRYGESFFADTVRGELVLTGGSVAAKQDFTWTWNGERWSRHDGADPLPLLGDPSSTFDTWRGIGLVFGGRQSTIYSSDLWGWNGDDWALVPATNRPPGRASAGMAFDHERGVVVVFGGAVGPTYQPGNLRQDTWEWNGASWTDRTGITKPSARESAAMAYDEDRDVMVLFGGRTGLKALDQLDDTWEWNGAKWTEKFPVVKPPPLGLPSLVADPLHDRVLLVGVDLTTYAFETWGYQGDAWYPVVLGGSGVSGGLSAVCDPHRQVPTIYDGASLRALTAYPASATTYGPSCGSAPIAALRARPRLGEPEFGLEAFVAPLQHVHFAVGVQPAAAPIASGCTFLVQPIQWFHVQADGLGVAQVTTPLPPLLSLLGLTAYAQALVIDGTKPLQVGASEGIAFTIGE